MRRVPPTFYTTPAIWLLLLSFTLSFVTLSGSLTLDTRGPNRFLTCVGHFLATSICEAADESEYVIGPTDVISVVTRERPDLSGTFIVSPEGNIVISLLGEVKAAGLTPSQLSRELTRKLSVFRVNEAVVTVLQYNSRRIFVVGEVAKPGKYTFAVIPSIWDVLSEAGGPTASALLSAVQVIRGDTGERLTVDMTKMLAGEAAERIELRPGDTIRVPSRTSVGSGGYSISILGEVRTSGTYEVALAKDLVSAVVAAGGPTEMADLKKIVVVRKSTSTTTVLKVNLEKFLKQGLALGNP